MLKVEPAAIADALLARQVMTHGANIPLASLGSGFAALVLVGLQWGVAPATVLLGWLGLLVVVLALRGSALRRPPKGADERERNRIWLRRHRVGFLAHGLVWGLIGLLPLPEGDALHHSLVLVVLLAVTASSFTLTAFDMVSALCFGVPVVVPLTIALFTRSDPTYLILGVSAIGVVVFLSLTAGRANRVVRKYVALSLSEAAQAEALRSSEDLLERTGATAGVGGWELDVDSMALRLTAQACRLHGADPKSPPGFDALVGLYAPPQQALIRQGVQALVSKGVPCDGELPFTTPAGETRWVRLEGRAQYEGGRVVRINGVVQDITEAKAAARALADKHHLLTLLLHTTQEGFWFIDTNGATSDLNPAMCRILGRGREAVLGRSIFDFVDDENAAVFRRELARRADNASGAYEIALQRPDGTRVYCLNNATPIVDASGRRDGSVGIWTDITDRKRAEHQLRATGELLAEKTKALQVTLDSISQGLVTMDANRRITVHNRRLLELLEFPPDLIGANTTLDDLARFQAARGDLGRGLSYIAPEARRPVEHLDHRNVPDLYVRETRSGGRLEVRTLHLPDGGLVRTYADVTDYVEAQRAVRDSEAQLLLLLEAFPGFIAVMDAQNRFSYANDRFARLLGKPREEIVGHPVREVVGASSWASVERYSAQARREGPVTVEIEFEGLQHQSARWLQVTYAIGDEEATGRRDCYAFGIDIGARKAAEEGLIAAKDEAERANRAKSQFLSNMSHELRTPMNAILGFGQLLGSDPLHPLAPHQLGHVQEILRGARHLLDLINEVLDLTLVETGKLQVSVLPVPVFALLRECEALLHPLARDRGVEVRVLDGAGMSGIAAAADPMRLKQVVLNLLANAIKYNRPGGHVHIGCAIEGPSVRLSISDTGPGISLEQSAHLFKAFERLDAARLPVEGAGLGLALSRQLLDAMGGEIGLDSEVGRGSTFWIRLPRAPHQSPGDAAGAAGKPAALALAAPVARTVLYIEDNPVNVLVMEAMLSRLPNLRLLTAALPMQGLRMAAEERPDLILLDIQLPGMDGFEVLQRLRANEPLRHVPVIAVSANAMVDDVEAGLAAGFARYLTKPLEMPALLAAVEAALTPP